MRSTYMKELRRAWFRLSFIGAVALLASGMFGLAAAFIVAAESVRF